MDVCNAIGEEELTWMMTRTTTWLSMSTQRLNWPGLESSRMKIVAFVVQERNWAFTDSSRVHLAIPTKINPWNYICWTIRFIGKF
jgi:hypothetical protein